jgi:hypothetical protein
MLCIFVALVCGLYIQYYTKYNTSYKILQTYLDKINIDTLYERYPVVIYDRVVDPVSLTNTLFKYSYTFKNVIVQKGSQTPSMTLNKYTLIYNIKDDIDINIISPFYKSMFTYKFANNLFSAKENIQDSNVEYVTIKLKKQQVLILPTYWLYQTTSIHHVLTMNDPFTILINLFNMWFRTSRV